MVIMTSRALGDHDQNFGDSACSPTPDVPRRVESRLDKCNELAALHPAKPCAGGELENRAAVRRRYRRRIDPA